MQEQVLNQLPAADLKVYVVWLPILKLDSEARVAKVCARVPDKRARHYWDGKRALGNALSSVLELGGRPAWDVYLLYGPKTHWPEAGVPKPDFWMHQLSYAQTENFLNGDRFRSEVTRIIGQ